MLIIKSLYFNLFYIFLTSRRKFNFFWFLTIQSNCLDGDVSDLGRVVLMKRDIVCRWFGIENWNFSSI